MSQPSSSLPTPPTQQFFVTGMHCRACVALIEDELAEDPRVETAKADLATQSVWVTGDFDALSPAELAQVLTPRLVKHGYGLCVEKPKKSVAWRDFRWAVPIALAFFGGFLLLERAGLTRLISAGAVSYATILLVGIIASLSTCMAVVGGLTLSLSATYAKEGETLRPQLAFHVGRLVSFFLGGGIIGALGSGFTPSPTTTFGITLVLGLVLFVMGVHLLDVFPGSGRWLPALPASWGRRVSGLSAGTRTLGPAVVGATTFFLPCGFTQSMQLYSLTTGSFLAGSLTMLTFALGTLPVLAVLSFGARGFQESRWSGVFFKTAGLVVIAFAIFDIVHALLARGFFAPAV